MILRKIKNIIVSPIKIALVLFFLILVLFFINLYGILGLNIDNTFEEISKEIFDIPIEDNQIELGESQKQIEINLYNEKLIPVLLPSFQIDLLMDNIKVMKTKTPITIIPSKKQKTLHLELTTNYHKIENLNAKKQIQVSILGIKVASF